MTNQEAIKIIEDECEHIKSHLKCKGKAEEYYKELGDMCIAFYMAINALEQEPSGDLISRQAVVEFVEYIQSIKDKHNNEGSPINYGTICDIVIEGWNLLKLPSVNPQEPKIGRWTEEDMFDGDVAYRCSECNELFWIESGTPKDNEYNFCPKCGAKMESEDKE